MTRRLAIAATALLAGCAARTNYMGVAFATAPAPVAATARAAAGGDRTAQYELALRYETGNGVPRDLPRAKRLYRLAGSDSGGTMFVYSPPVGKQKTGTMIPIATPKVYGVAAARARLAALNARESD